MNTAEKNDWHLLPRSVLKGFNDDALPISARSLLQNGAVRMLFCWWNAQAWSRSPSMGWMGEGGLLGEFQKTMSGVEHGY